MQKRFFVFLTCVALGAGSVVTAPAASADPIVLKPVIGGLVDRQGVPAVANQPVVDSLVVTVNWADLQPVAGGEIVTGNAIDQAIAAVRASALVGQAQIKIRLLAGGGAPAWAKSLGGAPVTIIDNTDGKTVTVGRFWTPAYQEAYADLQAKLAALYDGVPEVADVAISGCMTLYAEPMIRQTSNAQTRANLLAAGYTKAADLSCQSAAINAHLAWTTTRSSIAANPFQFVNPNGSAGVSVADALGILDQCRASLGAGCVLSNNSLRLDYLSGTGLYQDLYAGMLQRGGAITFQTATAEKVGSLTAVLEWAITNGVSAVELPKEYPTLLTAEQRLLYDTGLEADALVASL